MKKFTHLALISLLLLAAGCKKTEKDLIPQSGEVQFSMTNSAKSNGVLSGSPEAAVPAFVLLSFTDEQGKAVVSDKKMALYLFGEDFVSEVLKLNTGNYKLSKFLVLDAGNKIIYASPLSGSPQAQYVSKPLPLGFSITANGSTLVSPQVLKVDANTPPESFGYASFGFEVVNIPKPRLKEVLINEPGDPYKFVYYYQNDNVIKVEMTALSESAPTVFFNYFYNEKDQLSKSEFYQGGELFETILYTYNSAGKLVFVDGDHNKEIFYSNGLVSEVHISPGNFSNKEVVKYEYDNTGNPTKIITSGYTEFGVNKWVTTENYTYDNFSPLSGKKQSLYYQGGISYILPHLNNFTGIILTHNPVKLETSTYFDWLGPNVPKKHIVYSEFEYNKDGLPVSEKLYNVDNIGDFPNVTTLRTFKYE